MVLRFFASLQCVIGTCMPNFSSIGWFVWSGPWGGLKTDFSSYNWRTSVLIFNLFILGGDNRRDDGRNEARRGIACVAATCRCLTRNFKQNKFGVFYRIKMIFQLIIINWSRLFFIVRGSAGCRGRTLENLVCMNQIVIRTKCRENLMNRIQL